MTWNHHQPGESNEHDSLPDDLRALDQRLASDGARWRGALPPAEPLARRVAALLEAAPEPRRPNQPHPDSQQPAVSGPARQPHQRNDHKGRTPMHLGGRGRTRSWLTAAAALLVVGLMAALLFSLGLGRPGGQITARATATTTKVTKLTGHWQALLNLSKELTAPIIAPSDPRVAYELAAPSDNGVAHGTRRTDDGGATWHPLPNPVTPGPLMAGTIRVSPVDAHNVFLQVDFGVQQTSGTLNCPGSLANVAPSTQSNLLLAPLSNYGDCPALFYSTDGGDHWAPSQLPLASILAYTNASWPIVDLDVLQAQGGRLYAAMQVVPNGTSPVSNRLMVSSDQGATWQLADASLISQAPTLCDIAVSPQGTTLFAVTSDSNEAVCDNPSQVSLTIWRSDDDGAHWTQVDSLHTTVQQFAAGGSATQPLLYTLSLDTSGNPALKGLRASTDGARTWQTAPAAGIPHNMVFYQIAGILPDGSLVAAMVPAVPAGTTPFTQPRDTYIYVLYTWKAGEAAWHQLSPNAPTIGQPGYMLVASGGGTTSSSIWVVTINGDFLGGSGATYTTSAYVLG